MDLDFVFYIQCKVTGLTVLIYRLMNNFHVV